MPNAGQGVLNSMWRRSPQRDEQLVATFDRAAIGIVEVDAEGRVIRANRHSADLVGYSPDEMIGRSLFDPELTDDGARDAAEFSRQVAGEIDSYAIEKRFQRKNASWAIVVPMIHAHAHQ